MAPAGFGLRNVDPAYRSDATNDFQWAGTNLVAGGGWGRMLQLANHQWLAVNTHFARQESTLQIRQADDVTNSWPLVATVREPGRRLDNGELIQLPAGEILLTGRSLIDGQSYRLPVYRSGDGRTWNFLSNIDVNEGAPGSLSQRGLWEPHFFLLADGRLAVAYANEKHAADQPAFSQTCSERISADGGQTWGGEIILAAEPGGGRLRPGMPVVTRMANGTFIAVYEVVGRDDASVFAKISPDGEHWPPGLGRPIPGHHAGPFVVSLATGELLLTSCANQLSGSRDFGATWQSLGPPAWDFGPGKVFTWPAIYEIAPRQIAVMISRNGVRLRLGRLLETGTPLPP